MRLSLRSHVIKIRPLLLLRVIQPRMLFETLQCCWLIVSWVLVILLDRRIRMASVVASSKQRPSWIGADASSLEVYRAAFATMKEEDVLTLFYCDGRRFDLVGATDALRDGRMALPLSSAATATLTLKRLLRQAPDHCMKCRVICSREKHRCRDCLILTPLGHFPQACHCWSKCEFSVRVMHERESAALSPLPLPHTP